MYRGVMYGHQSLQLTCGGQELVVAFNDDDVDEISARDETTQRAVSHRPSYVHVLPDQSSL